MRTLEDLQRSAGCLRRVGDGKGKLMGGGGDDGVGGVVAARNGIAGKVGVKQGGMLWK